jgi:mRNA-degrading endonuclease RelE of RelBE toxin-antitoxin system
MRQIEWKKKAIRQIRKIKSQRTKNMIYDAVGSLKDFPNCPNVKKLKDRNDFRLRVGKWRIFFTDSLKILYIEEVKKRDEHTY